MDLPAAKETLENIRRAAERGLGAALDDQDVESCVDSFQHIQDELALLKIYLED